MPHRNLRRPIFALSSSRALRAGFGVCRLLWASFFYLGAGVPSYCAALEASLRQERPATAISTPQAGQRVPESARKALEKARKYRVGGKIDAALAQLDKAIRIYPGYFQAFAERGIVQIQSGKVENALRDFETAIRISPDYEPALSGAGTCLLTMGQYERSVAFLEKAVEIAPKHAQSLTALGIGQLALGRWQKAQESLERALQADFLGAASARVYLADALAAQHLYRRAAEELHTYLQINRDAPDADQLRAKEEHWRSLAAGNPR